MKTFTFLCVRQDGAVPSMELSEWTDVLSAQGRAAQLMAEHISCHVVEIWDDTQLCFSLTRNDDDAGFAAAAG